MKIIGDMTILTKEEIIKRGMDRYNEIKEKLDKYDKRKHKETIDRLQKEPLPYALFRMNELFDYTLNNIGCEITEEEYMDRLEQLPPVPFKYDIYEGYIIPECITGNIYEHIFEFDDKYYCVIMECKNVKVMGDWF